MNKYQEALKNYFKAKNEFDTEMRDNLTTTSD